MVKPGGEKGWYYFSLVVLIFFAGLRYRVGSDTLMYMSTFNEWPKLDELKYFDFSSATYNPLWYIFAAFARSFYDDFTTLQFLHAIVVNCTFFWFFRKYCPKYYFSAILLYYIGYFCYFNMEVMRESLCICVLLLSTSFLLEKRWLFYFPMCVIGIFIHYSAAIMLVLPLLFLFKKPSWKWEIVILLGIIVLMRVVNMPSLVLRLFGLNEQLIMLIEGYIGEMRNVMGIISEFLNFFPIFIFIYLREKHGITEKYDFSPLMMGTVVVYAFAMNIGIFSRFINYFVPFILVYAVNTVYRTLDWKFKDYQISYLLCMAAFVVLNFNMMRFYTKDMSESYPNTRAYVRYIPYHSVLNPKIDEHRERFVENDREVSIEF